MARYSARCVGTKDGDTFVAHYVSVSYVPGFRITAETVPPIAVRLLGVQCPEKNKPGGTEATAYSVGWFRRHLHDSAAEEHNLWLDEAGYDHFGRLLAVVSCRLEGECLNVTLLDSGHATVYRAGPDLDAHLNGLRGVSVAGMPGRLLADRAARAIP
jgi:endonuclease YncB( thermonuclease family)